MSFSQSKQSQHIQEADRSLSAYDYILPDDYIAQQPAVPRDSSKLLALTSPTEHQHHIFRELPTLLKTGDLLVLNNTRVIPARLFGQKSTGSSAEILLVEEQARNRWLALVKPGRRLKPGATIEIPLSSIEQPGITQEDRDTSQAGMQSFAPSSDIATQHEEPFDDRARDDFSSLPHSTHSASPANCVIATILETDTSINGRIIEFDVPGGKNLWEVLPQLGHVPLPPYVTNSDIDSDRYQTVFNQTPGAVAAPTAGLHFTPELLAQLEHNGISHCFTTLHVGIGTFRPVEVDDITTHSMHHEWIDVPETTVERIRNTKANGGRVIAVGTTVTRALESAAQQGALTSFRGKTNLFIYPGYQWHVIDGLITNFHLPKSSLLMMVSALIGRERLLSLYEDAIAQHYRFYSFGDAMVILPEAQQSRITISPLT